MSARMLEEIRIPVPTPPEHAMIDDTPGAPAQPTPVEYYVVEKWSDFTIRHPTNGRQVAAEAFHEDPKLWLRWLRTGRMWVDVRPGVRLEL